MFLLKLLLLPFILFLFSNNALAYPGYPQAIKEKKIYPMGEKIYNKKCPELDISKYKTYEDMSEDILSNKKCGELNNKYSEALFLYLWEVKKGNKAEKIYPKIEVTKEQKCPVCGMFLYKYPNWISMIEYKNGKKVYFDGMKDLLKYYFSHKDNVKEILTQEYYTQKTIAVKDAYFVIGSDIYGPMGREFIGFKDKEAADKFLLDHRGTKVLKFENITEEIIKQLDE